MPFKYKVIAAITVALFIAPAISLAQTTSLASLQTEITALLAQVQSLESQLTTQGGSAASSATPSVASCFAFTTNLSVGMSGSAVTALQTALQNDGESVQVTGTFDDQTAAAVTGFQEKYASAILAPYSLSNGTGYVGIGTRTELNSLFRCVNSNPNPTSTSPIICPAWGCGAPPHPILGSSTISTSSTLPIICPAWGCGGPPPRQPIFGSSTIVSTSTTSTLPIICPAWGCGAPPHPILGSSTIATSSAPYISQVNPPSAAPGAPVTISGQNFDSNSYITLGAAPTGVEVKVITPTSETPTSLTFTVPSNFATGVQALYVAEYGSNLMSNQAIFTITAALVTPPVSSPIGCPAFIPYCPNGYHAVPESDGCSELVCNVTSTIGFPIIKLQSSASDTNDQTKVIEQSLQNELSQLGALLQSL